MLDKSHICDESSVVIEKACSDLPKKYKLEITPGNLKWKPNADKYYETFCALAEFRNNTMHSIVKYYFCNSCLSYICCYCCFDIKRKSPRAVLCCTSMSVAPSKYDRDLNPT